MTPNLKRENPLLNNPITAMAANLKPAAVQANQRHDEDNQGQPVQPSAISGSTLDDEGLINNFAVEPTVYPSEYPSPPSARALCSHGSRGSFIYCRINLFCIRN